MRCGRGGPNLESEAYAEFIARISDADLLRRQAAWDAARIAVGRDPNEWRLDEAGRAMRFSDYCRATPTGWIVVQQSPSAAGGPGKAVQIAGRG